MKNYHSLLLAKTAVCFLLISQPSHAVNPSETDLAIASPLMTEDKVVDEAKISIERDLEKDLDILKSDSPVVKIKGLDTPSLEVAPKIAQSYNQPINPPVGRPSSPNGVMVPNPEIIIKSNGTANPTIIQPTIPSLPVLPGAVAPPVGDMSISNINASPAILDLGPAGNTIIPRLVLRQAPADEVLKVLARYAGVNLVSIDSTGGTDSTQAAPAATASSSGNANISLDIENEPVQNVFNSVLMASGLKASRRGNTLFVGKKLPDEARNTVTRTLRLNQAKAENVATILASQGAEFNLLTQPEVILDPGTTTIAGGEISITPPTAPVKPAPTLTSVKVTADKESGVSYLLKDLLVSIDDRLNSLTLIGEPRQVEIATSIVLQMDARRRQVSINVKVVDFNLSNTQTQSIDFNFGDGNNYGYNQSNNTLGSTILNFGNGVGLGGLIPNPTQFSATLNYAISVGNAKVLTDPTLVVQEGQVANVAIVQKVLSGSKTTYQTTGTGAGAVSVPVTEPEFDYVGLTLGINVESIDDNGFISFVVRPTISAPSGTVEFSSGTGGVPNTFTLISKREVQSGLVRLRDGQTLILSGIITQQDRSTVTKVPILGDIPLLGVLFRSQDDVTERSEVVVMLTPKIIHDDQNSQFGNNYTPSKEASDLLRQNNFPAQAQP
jgi:type IV pilus assembly protein PilQ